MQVTLDASGGELHNRHRGRSHSAALSAIRLLSKADIPALIGASIFGDTVDEVYKLAELADAEGCRLRCSAIDRRGRAAAFPQRDSDATVHAAIATAIKSAASRFPNVFMDPQESEPHLDDEMHCKFFHGMVAVGADGRIRPCLESKGFFRRVAPWAFDDRPAWELANIEEHAAFATVSTIDQRYKPTVEGCGSCVQYGLCRGCLLAGYSCQVQRRDTDEEEVQKAEVRDGLSQD